MKDIRKVIRGRIKVTPFQCKDGIVTGGYPLSDMPIKEVPGAGVGWWGRMRGVLIRRNGFLRGKED